MNSYRYVRSSYMFSICLFVISLLVLLFYANLDSFLILGILIIITSVDMIRKVVYNEKLLLLFSIIGYINCCVAVLDCIMGGGTGPQYMMALRHSLAGLQGIKCYLLFCTVFNLMIVPNFADDPINNPENLFEKNEYNPAISIGMLLLGIYITITQFSGKSTGGDYVSNSNALYEYVIMFVLLGLYYSGENKILRRLFDVLAIFYILQGVMFGDRSSAFMMVLLLAMVYFQKRLKIEKVLFFSFLGILASNIIGVLRSAVLSVGSLVQVLLNRGAYIFFSDTVSFSFYSGITIISFKDIYTGDKLELFVRWIKNFLMGGGNSTDLALLVQRQYIHNGGGGMFPIPFYFYGGYLFVACIAIMLGLLIRMIFTGKSRWAFLMQYLMIVYVFSWYIYSPQGLIRTLLVNFSIVYFVCVCTQNLSRGKTR